MADLDIVSELDANQVILVLIPSEQYNARVIEIAKPLSKKSLCYVTLNKTAESLKETFKKSKVPIKQTIFIDAITKTFRHTEDTSDGTYYVSSPAALTDISLLIDKCLKHDFEYLIFDSLTNLLVYEDKAPVAKFINTICNKIRASKTKAVFYALTIKEHEALIKQSQMFVDKVITIDIAEGTKSTKE